MPKVDELLNEIEKQFHLRPNLGPEAGKLLEQAFDTLSQKPATSSGVSAVAIQGARAIGAARAIKSVEEALSKAPELQPFANEISQFILNNTTPENKASFTKSFEKMTAKYSDATIFGQVVENLNNMAKDPDLAKKIGPNSAKEFSEKVQSLDKEFKAAPDKEKGGVLVKNLESMNSWSKEKEKALGTSRLKKFGSMLLSFAKAAGSWITRDGKAHEQHMLNAKQSWQELTGKKAIAQELTSTQNKTQAWTKKAGASQGR